jgi:hypothetical protein
MVTADTYRLSDAPICNVDPFLQLAPELEQQFWSSPTTMNIVRYLDLVAYSLPIINLIMTVPRRMKEVPQDIQLPLGARLFLLAYVAVAVAMLVLLVGRPEVYKRNRMNLAMLNRTFRLVSAIPNDVFAELPVSVICHSVASCANWKHAARCSQHKT